MLTKPKIAKDPNLKQQSMRSLIRKFSIYVQSKNPQSLMKILEQDMIRQSMSPKKSQLKTIPGLIDTNLSPPTLL